jgi:hypothetical protein
MQSVPIINKVVNLNPVHGGVYSIQHYINMSILFFITGKCNNRNERNHTDIYMPKYNWKLSFYVENIGWKENGNDMIGWIFLLYICFGPSWSWSHGSWIYNYLCNRCLSPIKLWIWIPFMVGCTRYNII